MSEPEKIRLIWLIIAIVGFVILSAFFSCADMVYGVVDQLKLKKQAEKGKKLAKASLKFAENYDITITTILFCNNLVNIGASSLGALIGLDYIDKYCNMSGFGTTIMTIVILVALLIFGEIIPKVIGRIFSYRLSILFVIPIYFFKIIFYPIVSLTSLLGKLIAKPFTKKKKKDLEEEQVSGEELEEMVDAIEEEGLIDEDKGELMRSAIEFKETEAFEIMTPRIDMYAIDIEDDIYELIKNEEDQLFSHSRIPVYQDTIDNIIGVIYTKVILGKLLKGEKIDIKSLLVKPNFVPRSMLINDILEKMKKDKIHIAFVKDEYGGIEGLLTIEDILEELVGEIFDENDEIVEPYTKIEENKYIVDGSMNLDDFFDLFDLPEDETDYSTVGGWCIDKIGRFAKLNDKFNYEFIEVLISEVTEFTVEKIIVKVNKEEEQ